MVKGAAHIRTQNPCARCAHLPDCESFLHRLSDVVAWEELHHAGYEPPTVIVDCEGRFSPPSRTLPVTLH